MKSVREKTNPHYDDAHQYVNKLIMENSDIPEYFKGTTVWTTMLTFFAVQIKKKRFQPNETTTKKHFRFVLLLADWGLRCHGNINAQQKYEIVVGRAGDGRQVDRLIKTLPNLYQSTHQSVYFSAKDPVQSLAADSSLFECLLCTGMDSCVDLLLLVAGIRFSLRCLTLSNSHCSSNR